MHEVTMKLSTLRRHFLFGSLALVLGASISAPSFAADLLDEIKARGAIKVGLEGTYPPFNYQDENGKLAALESKRLDVVINQVTISDERKKKYDFSTPYTVSGIQALTRKADGDSIKNAQDLAGKKVGVGLGTNYEQWLKDNVPQADIRTYDDDPTKFQDLNVGRIDVILVDRLAAFEMVEKTGGRLAVAGDAFSRQEAGIALRKGNPALLAAIDQALAKLSADGTLKQLSEKWFKADVTR
jgi:L-cystine transport system substrate-binding protein